MNIPVALGKTLNSQCLFLNRCINGYGQIFKQLGGNPATVTVYDSGDKYGLTTFSVTYLNFSLLLEAFFPKA